MNEIDLIIKNAGELLTLSTSFRDESGLGILKNGAVTIRKERIFWVGDMRQHQGGHPRLGATDVVPVFMKLAGAHHV